MMCPPNLSSNHSFGDFILRKLGLLLFFALVALPVSHAAELVKVSDAWIRLPPPGAKIAAAYLTLESKQTLSLIAVTSPAAEVVEMHSMSTKNGVMEMRQLPTLKIEAGKPTKLEPGGLHLMLINLKQPLKSGDQVKLSLRFKQNKQRVNILATVHAPTH